MIIKVNKTGYTPQPGFSFADGGLITSWGTSPSADYLETSGANIIRFTKSTDSTVSILSNDSAVTVGETLKISWYVDFSIPDPGPWLRAYGDGYYNDVVFDTISQGYGSVDFIVGRTASDWHLGVSNIYSDGSFHAQALDFGMQFNVVRI